jgi:hypothetical protein
MKTIVVLFAIALCLPLGVRAQITITEQDFQSYLTPGNSIPTDSATTFGTVTVGTASATTQTFDLTSASFIPDYTISILSPAACPLPAYSDSLGATFALAHQAPGKVRYSFGSVAEGYVLGIGAVDVNNSTVLDTLIYSTFDHIFAYPLTYGSQWTSMPHYTSKGSAHSDTTEYSVDAFGTVKFPNGSFNCLRLRSKPNSNKNFSYIFITKEAGFAVVTIDTANDGMPVVTPRSIGVTDYHPSAVREIQSNPIVAASLQIYPMPLHNGDALNFAYSVPHGGVVDIKLVNMYGETIAELVHGAQSAGVHESQTMLDGVGTGAYLCVMQMEGRRIAQPVVFVR